MMIALESHITLASHIVYEKVLLTDAQSRVEICYRYVNKLEEEERRTPEGDG